MKLFDMFLSGRRQFNEQVDRLFADFDYGRESAKIDALLRDADPQDTSDRVASLLRKALPEEYLCERPDCEGMYVRRHKSRRGLFLGCSNYPECDSRKWVEDDPLRPHERRRAWRTVANAAPDRERWRKFQRSRREALRRLKYLYPGSAPVRKGSTHGTVRDQTD